MHIEVSSATRGPRPFKKRGSSAADGGDDTSSDRVKILSENFIGSRGRNHHLTKLYVQKDINESFATSENAAVALVLSGSGMGKIAKDYKSNKGVSMLGNAWDGTVAPSFH